jgi:hypothetical protein
MSPFLIFLHLGISQENYIIIIRFKKHIAEAQISERIRPIANSQKSVATYASLLVPHAYFASQHRPHRYRPFHRKQYPITVMRNL